MKIHFKAYEIIKRIILLFHLLLHHRILTAEIWKKRMWYYTIAMLYKWSYYCPSRVVVLLSFYLMFRCLVDFILTSYCLIVPWFWYGFFSRELENTVILYSVALWWWWWNCLHRKTNNTKSGWLCVLTKRTLSQSWWVD